MDGVRHAVKGAGGVDIGLLSAGSGPPLLLVHGGVGQIERWQALWDELSTRWRVTAMDRRGRGSSGDGSGYSIDDEFQDVTAVAAALSKDAGMPIDVFGHSYGATCTLGASSRAAPFRRIVLYEPPGKETVSPDFVERLDALVVEGRSGKAMVSFLVEIIGLTTEEVEDLRRTPPAYDILSVLSRTLPREARALLGVDVATVASRAKTPALFLLGERSPEWAHVITRQAAKKMPISTVTVLAGLGHEAIDAAPALVTDALARFFNHPDAS